jgi:hypothetical protein
MQVRFKFRSVHEELQNQNWIKNLKQVDSEELLGEFILLYQALSEIQLNGEKDTIHWIWNRNGVYSAASAYDAQFIGAYPQFNAPTIWQTESEPKCRFFAWLAALRKAPTADNLSKKNWPCELSCALCFCIPESIDHLLMECNISETVWNRIAQTFDLHPTVAQFQKRWCSGLAVSN